MRLVGATSAGFLALAAASAAVAAEPPAIRANGVARQLFVDGRPFLILGGEVYNSSASSPRYMRAIWDRAQAAGVNTLLAPVAWNQFEPQEGRFDPAVLDALIGEAKTRDMRLVVLWLGAFKNARSTYAPTWVRADRHRFPRADTTKPDYPTGALATTKAPVLSAFTPALREADGRAFAALMAHIGSRDPDHRVIMVQVENETGLLGDSRDRSPAAEAAWSAPVPKTLTDYLSRHAGALTPELDALWAAQGRPRTGTWPQVFGAGPRAEETFMAWHVARYVEVVARAGRAVSALPLYTGWQGPEPGEPNPGDYPSGGPTGAMLDIWNAAAPTLALLAPDIYVDDAQAVQARYARSDNPLFVPEARFRPGDVFMALGSRTAIGHVTFGIDEATPGSRLADAYRLLQPMGDVIAKAQAEGRIAGVLVQGEGVQTVRLGAYEIALRDADAFERRRRLDMGAQPPPPPPPPASETTGHATAPDTRAFGLVIALGRDRFLFAGQGFMADVAREGRPVEIDRIQEGTYANGHWQGGRVLNGDEYGQVVPRDRLGATEVQILP